LIPPMQWFVFGQNIAKFQPKKIKSEPVQRRFHGKNGPNSPDFKETKKIQITRFS